MESAPRQMEVWEVRYETRAVKRFQSASVRQDFIRFSGITARITTILNHWRAEEMVLSDANRAQVTLCDEEAIRRLIAHR